jgi:PAS domain S-box-containing protein
VHPSQEARLLATLDHERTWREMLQAKLTTVEVALQQAREQLVLARLEGQQEHQASARNAKICTALQERLLELEAAVRQIEQQRAADAAAAVDRLTQRHAEFTASLAHAARARDTLAQQLTVARAALEEGRQAREADEIATAVSRAAVEQQVERLRAALQQAEARHESERAADAERRAGRDAEAAASRAQVAEERDTLARQLSLISAALEESQAQRALADADARATLAQTEAEAASTRAALERQLSDAAAALEQIREQRAAEAAAAAQRLTQREAEFEVALAAAGSARAAVEEQVERLRATIQETEARHESERTAAAERHAAREAEVAATVAQISDEREALARQLSTASTALEQAKEARAAEASAAAERLTAREAEFEVALAAADSARAAVEEQVERLRATIQETEARHESERGSLTRQLSDVSAALEESQVQRAREESDARAMLEQTRAEAAATREAFERRLSDAGAALEQAQEQRAADTVAAARRLAERETEFGTMLADAAAIRSGLERRLDEVQLALRNTEQLAEAERASASSRERSILDDLARESEVRAGVERELNETRAESARGRHRLLTAASALRRRTSEHRARLEAQFAAEREDHDRRVDAQGQQILHLEAERDALQTSLGAVRGELQELRASYDEARRDFEQAHAKSDADLRRVSAEYDQSRHSLDHLRGAFNTLEQVSSEHALERSRLEGVVIDRDAQISAQAATHVAAEQAWKEASRRAEEALRQSVDARNSDIAALQRQLDASQQENRRQFEHAPHAMCRVTPDGALAAANRALARVLGYRPDDLAKLDLAAAVFEAPADLRWLIDRAATGSALEPVEAVWKRKDRTRLTIRLQVVRTTANWIELAAEDITQLRATEEDLRHARRMEAVGRLASEVAVTCDTLLRGVSHGGQHWLAAMGSDLGLRHQGERLLGDVAHATSLLQRLAAYGNEQSDALEPVNLRRVLRNFEPVLKRVVGDGIEVVLPKHIPPLSLDVERPRVERVLVNVASYARERMPYGGRLKIDLASTVVDRAFLDKYPNVRPGPHVIATVTEVRGTTAADPRALWPNPSGDDATKSSADRPGVDLSALVQLLSDCGGHLWVTAEPPGNMTLKIHLPLRSADGANSPAPSLARSNSGRSLGRWFRH